MRATSEKHGSLRVSFPGGSVKFVGGAAEVDEAQAGHLLGLPKSYGIAVEGFEPFKAAEESGGDETELFDPSKHNADDVHAYLASIDDADTEAHDAEVARVLEAEKAGKNRKGIVEAIEGTSNQ